MEAVLGLSLKDKEVLFQHLGVLILQERKESRSMAKDLVEEIKESVCAALDVPAYNPTSRERKDVLARVITSNILLRMGYTESNVGKMVEKNHSTIHHYKTIMEAWEQYPGYYEEEITIWNQIKKAYETDTRTI